MRQRRVLMPTTGILETHMKDTYEVLKLNEEIEQGTVGVPTTNLSDWEETPRVHENTSDNKHEESSYVINHALPHGSIDSKKELFDVWGI